LALEALVELHLQLPQIMVQIQLLLVLLPLVAGEVAALKTMWLMTVVAVVLEVAAVVTHLQQ
jgi:hypothetical protein